MGLTPSHTIYHRQRKALPSGHLRLTLGGSSSQASKGRGRGRPPTTGKYVGLAKAREAYKRAQQLLVLDRAQHEMDRLEAEREVQAMHIRTRQGFSKGAPSSPAPNPEEAAATKELGEQVADSVAVILKVATNSKNLQGGYIRRLKDAASAISDAFDVLSKRTVSEETARLQADNNRLRSEMADLRKEMAETKAQLEGLRKQGDPAPLPPVRNEEARSPALPAPTTEEICRVVMAQVGTYLDARMAEIRDRLPPEKRVRPPLATLNEARGAELKSGTAPAVSSVPAAEDDQPYLKVNTLKNLFNVGEKKAIFCEGKHLSGDLEWYDPSGEKIQPRTNKNKRIYIEHRPPPSEGPTFLPLMIKSLFLNDSGIYTCKAGDLNATINIFVAEKVVIKEKEQDYDAEEGHSVELSCLAKGTPTPEIQWYKDNIVEPIVTNEKYRITYKLKASTSILKINDLSHMDPGTYRCRATQETISHFVEKICHLRVRHKPVIMNSYSEREVYAIMDEWKNITCKAVAFPPPTFTWSKHTGNYDEELNTDNEEFHITSSSSQDSDTSSVLTLHITNETLDQQYKCSVWNTKGRQNFIFHVSLGNKPDPPTAVTMVSATVNNITFEVACENCTFFKEDGLAPSPENLPVLGYVFQSVPRLAGFAVPYWINGTTYTFDISEYNGTTFTIDNLDKDTEYHVRVATRNLAGLSDWYDVQGLPKTTDGAAILAKSIGLFIFTLIVSLTN